MEHTNPSRTKLAVRAPRTTFAPHVEKLAIVQVLLLLLLGGLSGTMAAQSGASKEGIRCRDVCLQIRRDASKWSQQDIEMHIENRTDHNISVADLGFAVSASSTQTRPKHQYVYYSPVNIELGVPISPLPNGAFPKSSMVLAPHQSIHWHFNMTELYWTNGLSPIRYGKWESAVPGAPS